MNLKFGLLVQALENQTQEHPRARLELEESF